MSPIASVGDSTRQTSPSNLCNFLPSISAFFPHAALTERSASRDTWPVSYLPRVVDHQLAEALATAGAVVLEGPKACGKTDTALRSASSSVRFDVDPTSRETALIDPFLVLEGATPRLLDEWQRAPDVWDAVRRAVDDRRATGQFILTGSAAPADALTRHSGAMRFERLRMRPMSLFESGAGIGAVSFADIANGDSARAPASTASLSDIATAAARGGWPGNLQLTTARALRQVRSYVSEIARVDIREAGGIAHDPQTVQRLMRSIARNVGTPAGVSAITRDVNGTDGKTKDETVSRMMAALQRLMVLEELPAWAPAIRSRTRLRGANVRHFVDPSIAVAAVGADDRRMLADPAWFGFMFESLALRDIRIFSQALGGSTYHYRDASGLEADIVVEFPDGRWMACEVKLGHGQLDLAALSLLKLRDRIDIDATGECSALVVITPTGHAYRRPDGVLVIPLPLLGP